MIDHPRLAAADRNPGPPRLLVVGPALDRSSYSRVLHGTLGPLARAWDIRHLGINYDGAPVDCGWPIVPNASPDRYAIREVVSLTRSFAPDAIFILNSFFCLPRYWRLPELLGPRRPLLVAHCPVLGEANDPRLVARLAFFDMVVVLSDGVRRHLAECFDECLHDGFIDRVPRLEVIPHGFDAALFHPVDRREARVACGLPPEAFVVLNANRNERRKRVDLTLEGFARFAGDQRDVLLYLHMEESREGQRIRDLAYRFGIAGRVILDDRHLDDRELNLLYNACDVGLNTASSEGWGMVSFEHAATGAAQIVSGSWVTGEIWRDHAELLDAAESQAPRTGITREVIVSVDSVADSLERLDGDADHRREMARRGASFARREKFQWTSIAARWDELLRRNLEVGAVTRFRSPTSRTRRPAARARSATAP